MNSNMHVMFECAHTHRNAGIYVGKSGCVYVKVYIWCFCCCCFTVVVVWSVLAAPTNKTKQLKVLFWLLYPAG